MDEYKEFVYKKRPFMRNLDIGNIEDQKNLRKRLRCKSFDWFMTQIAPDIIKYYPAEVPPAVAWGDVSFLYLFLKTLVSILSLIGIRCFQNPVFISLASHEILKFTMQNLVLDLLRAPV